MLWLACDQVVQEGGKLLYDSYIAHKSFLFAAEATCEAGTSCTHAQAVAEVCRSFLVR